MNTNKNSLTQTASQQEKSKYANTQKQKKYFLLIGDKGDKFWESFYLWLSSSFYCEFVGDQPNGENLLSPSRTWLRFRRCSIFLLQPHLRNSVFAIHNNWFGEDCSIASIGILLASVLMREGVAAKQIYNHNEINSKLHKVNQLQNSKRCKFLSKEKRNGN